MKNRKLIFVLGILVLGVWGTVGYKIYTSTHVSGDDGSASPLAPTGPARTGGTPYAYIADVRDPFSPPHMYGGHPDSSNADRHSKIGSQTTKLPPIRLTGILMARKVRTATLEEATSGAIHFLKEGDTIGGIKVLKIGTESVTCLYQKRRFDLHLGTYQ